ncbi:hypothetical protein jhhlp_002109, partial [Lomentospora prolificans]
GAFSQQLLRLLPFSQPPHILANMHGYSSSEESEDPKRPRAVPSSSSNNNDQKKKKKKKPPPQAAINRIWKKLQAKQPTIPLAVLPFDPVLPPAGPDRANESSAASYERAVEECRRKVRKIIQECRRVNTRYRDPGWDLDWDLKMGKGNCLNYLGNETYEVGYPPSSNANLPKSVKRVHEIFENPTFMKNVSSSDIIQGSIGNCWIIAALSALIDVEGGIQRLCVEWDTRVGIYGFVFYRDGEWVYSIIDDKLYLKSPNWDCPSLQRQLLAQIDREDVELHYRKTYQTGSKALFFGKNKDQNETWLPLLEKAYAKAHGDYASLIGGWIGEGLEDMTGGVTTELLASDILDTDAFWDDELSKVNKEFMFGCSTGILDGGTGSRDGIAERHAYVVMDARTLKSGQRLVKLRNPWGKTRRGVWEGPWSDGSKEWTTDVQKELGHHFGNDSVFWISYEDLLSKYQHFDRTRLFSGTDWGCCQRWIGVDVPWKADYHEKFHIKLTKDSPLVLVLSQLDRRYFKGLEGQYNFRLQFRVHEKGRPGAEDYIVRSHGNYLMTRSVSIDVPDMPAGEYTVFILVTAERYTHKPSVDEVVKRECKKRVENEKLAQVGYAYDLAHSKAHHHIEKIRDMRKKANQAKASNCRKSERRKQWERRRTERTIKRKQLEKNEAKKARLIAERDAKNNANEENKQSESESTEESSKEEEAPAKDSTSEKNTADATSKDASAEAKSEYKPSEDKVETAEEKKEETSKEKPAASEDASTPHIKKGEETLGATPSDPKLGEANNPDVAEKAAAKTATGTKPEEPKEAPPAEAKSAEESKPVEKKEKKSKKKKSTPKEPASPPTPIDYSSDSPVEDWEAIYSSDDYIRKPRTQPIPETTEADRYPSEDEKLPDPWNAVCIVGFKVFSRDSDLELRVVMEGGDMLEGGMGQKGEKDLDNAQANAAGEREETCNAFTTYNPIVVAGENSEKESDGEPKVSEQTEDEDGDDESEGEETSPKKLRKNKTTKQPTEGSVKESVEVKREKKEDTPAPKPDANTPVEEKPEPAEETKSETKADTLEDTAPVPPVEKGTSEVKQEKPKAETSQDDELRKKEEEMRMKEELIKKWEAELKKKEEEILKKEEEMKKRAEDVRKREEEEKKKDEDDYVDCEETSSDTSSAGVRTPDPTPIEEIKSEILG